MEVAGVQIPKGGTLCYGRRLVGVGGRGLQRRDTSLITSYDWRCFLFQQLVSRGAQQRGPG